jgi:hypothetical protein
MTPSQRPGPGVFAGAGQVLLVPDKLRPCCQDLGQGLPIRRLGQRQSCPGLATMSPVGSRGSGAVASSPCPRSARRLPPTAGWRSPSGLLGRLGSTDIPSSSASSACMSTRPNPCPGHPKPPGQVSGRRLAPVAATAIAYPDRGRRPPRKGNRTADQSLHPLARVHCQPSRLIWALSQPA